tara:strand:+ start:988 stop:1626 length:639 start_codon:yes stop_codon:yes gene_type:complete
VSCQLLILGAGGHGSVVLDAALVSGMDVLGLTDADPNRHGNDVLGRRVLGNDDYVLSHDPAKVLLAVGIGSTRDTALRREVFERFSRRGYRFATIVHPRAVVAPSAELGEGTVVMAGAVVQPRCRIAANVIINTGAQIDHDGTIGPHCHIAPGAVLSGNVTVESDAHIGAGTTVIQGITIGANALCAAGAVVVRPIRPGSKVAGNPATEMAP